MIISVDFETYYDREFSLSKMTTEEYVRDDNFEVIGVGVKVDDAETEWFSGTYSETMRLSWRITPCSMARSLLGSLVLSRWHG